MDIGLNFSLRTERLVLHELTAQCTTLHGFQAIQKSDY